MDNVAIVKNPCVSVDKKIPSDGSFKVAKMSKLEKTPKIQTLSARWQKELAKLETVVSKVTNTAAMVMDKLFASTTDFYSKALRDGARKLKVNEIVANKSRAYYGVHNAIVITKKEEPVKDVAEAINNITIEEEKVQEEEPTVDSRMSRLERTGEVYANNANAEYEEPKENKIINTPTRFERYNENPYDALINDNANVAAQNENSLDNRVKSSDTRGGDPNLYNELIHGAKADDVSSQLLEAKNRLSNAQKERAKAKAVNKSLEDEIANIRKTIDNIKREKQEKAERELSNTLNMLDATKEEILGETRKYDNLQGELAELIRQRDNLLNGSSVYEDNVYSRSRM